MPLKFSLGNIKSWKQSLFQPVPASSLGLFRMLFGLILTWQIFYVFDKNFIVENFLKAHYHFPFTIFETLHLAYLAPVPLYMLFFILGLAALLIFAGFFVRTASMVFFLGFLYIFLSEKSLYNDYHYLLLLLTFLLTFMDADRWPRLNIGPFKKTAPPQIPFWQIFILRMQFVIIYFYAALAKISVDWLIHAQPLKDVLSTKSFLGFSGDHLWLAYLLSWGGFLLDLTLAILLLIGRWRPVAYTGILLFNLINLWLFRDIGAFPILMIAGLVLFLDPETPATVTAKFPGWGEKRREGMTITKQNFEPSKLVVGFVLIYLAIQVLVPLRHFLYPDNPSWSYEGSRFAWRLKINAKKVTLKITAVDPVTSRSLEIPYENLLTPQQTWLDNIPDMLLQYVHQLKIELQETGIAHPAIYVEGYAKYNNHPRQAYIDGKVNLAETQYPLFSHAPWIIPLK